MVDDLGFGLRDGAAGRRGVEKVNGDGARAGGLGLGGGPRQRDDVVARRNASLREVAPREPAGPGDEDARAQDSEEPPTSSAVPAATACSICPWPLGDTRAS